jgi:hypothetical protein
VRRIVLPTLAVPLSLPVAPIVLSVGLPVLHVLPGLIAVDVGVSINVAIHIDVDVAAPPVAVTPRVAPGRPERDTDSERN